jgi:superfamily II DNA or RNA helicase
MFQTLFTNLGQTKTRNFLRSLDAIIVDEVHTLAAVSTNAVSMQTPNAFYRFGLSGTPLQRGDKRSPVAIGATGPVIYRIKAQELIDRGIIAKPNIIMYPCFQESDRSTHDAVYSELISRSSVRNKLVVQMAKRGKKPMLCFVKHTDHGHTLNQMLNAAGIPSEFVWGDKDTPKRKAAIQRLRHGEIEVIVCSVVFNTGIDIPELQSLVLAAGGKSAIAALQRVGRGTRAFDKDGKGTKSEVDIFDVMDLGNKMMERHTRARLKAFAIENYHVKVANDPHGIALKKLKMRAAHYESEDVEA